MRISASSLPAHRAQFFTTQWIQLNQNAQCERYPGFRAEKGGVKRELCLMTRVRCQISQVHDQDTIIPMKIDATLDYHINPEAEKFVSRGLMANSQGASKVIRITLRATLLHIKVGSSLHSKFDPKVTHRCSSMNAKNPFPTTGYRSNQASYLVTGEQKSNCIYCRSNA